MADSPEYKKAAIDWLLTVGECRSERSSTGGALAVFAERGIDYEASEAPSFGSALIEPGDSFNDARFGKAFTAEIVPVGANPEHWDETYTFAVNEDDMLELLVGVVIQGVIAASGTGDAAWKSRASTMDARRC